jgi:hypothetical protein
MQPLMPTQSPPGVRRKTINRHNIAIAFIEWVLFAYKRYSQEYASTDDSNAGGVINPDAALTAAEQLLVGLLQFASPGSFLNSRGFPFKLAIVFGIEQ